MPVQPGTGNKLQVETDYRGSGPLALIFTRVYNSAYKLNDYNRTSGDPLGLNWSGNYFRSLDLTNSSNGSPPGILAQRPNGQMLYFRLSGSAWVPDADITDTFERLVDGSGQTTGWRYTAGATDEIETYSASGQLLSIRNRSGLTQQLTYSDGSTPVLIAPKPGLLIKVADSFGRTLQLNYNSYGRLVRLIDPAGETYEYAYDPNKNKLLSVTYPDASVRTYLYDEPGLRGVATSVAFLTGITDENGQRFASFGYDSSGRASSTEHAGGVGKATVTYESTGLQPTVTEYVGSPGGPVSVARAYTFQT
ncbi:MAG: DUF6531 domain-containing protein, partial [Bryobacteraceae bacterium]